MKRFTDFEKKAIQAILDLQAQGGLNVIANFWEVLFPNLYYIDVTNPAVPVLMVRSAVLTDNIALQDMLGTLTRNADSLVSLLRFLEANNYIKLVGSGGPDSLGEQFADQSYAAYPLNVEAEVFQPLAAYAKRRIIVDQSLFDLVQNGFKTEDEIKLDEQVRANRFTTRTTLFGLFIAAIGLTVTAIDTVKKWGESETRVIIVNSDKPSGGIPINLRVVQPIDGGATTAQITQPASQPNRVAPSAPGSTLPSTATSATK